MEIVAVHDGGAAADGAGVYIAENKFGRGVFAGRPIRKNERILEFDGPVISLADVLQRPPDRQSRPLQIDDGLYRDISEPGVLANHSCDPNTGIREDRLLFALRDIFEDEEITYDYSTTMDEDNWTMACRCGSARCRGLVEDFRKLPRELQGLYMNLGIVQNFIARRAMAVMALAR